MAAAGGIGMTIAPKSTRIYKQPRGLSTYVDDAVVDRLIAGDHESHYTAAELAQAIDRLDNGARTAQQVADRLGIARRTVERHRAKRAVA